jgi:monoamine oxidase
MGVGLRVIVIAAVLSGCAASPEFTQLGADRYKVSVRLGHSQAAARSYAERAGIAKCHESHEDTRFYDYIDPLSVPGRFSEYFECFDTGDLIE